MGEGVAGIARAWRRFLASGCCRALFLKPAADPSWRCDVGGAVLAWVRR
jgi:hypothetical protein